MGQKFWSVMDGRSERGTFALGHPGSKPVGAKAHRTREIEELAREIIERRGGVDGLLERFFREDADPKLFLDAVKLVLGYAYGLPRQRIAVSGDAPVAVVIRRASAGSDAPAAASAPADDRGSPGEVPGDLGGATVGEEPDGR